MNKFAALALAALASTATHAAISVGDPSPDGVKAGTYPELFLVIWDQSNTISYVKDLGVSAYKDNYALGAPATNLFVYGQQDAGYQKLYAPLNTDPAFQTFLATSTDVTKQIWAVMGVAVDPNGALAANGTSFYTTAHHSAATGTVDGDYTKLLNWGQSEMSNAAQSLTLNVADINNKCTGTDCTTKYSDNLTGTFTKTANPLQYAGASYSSAGVLAGSPAGPSLFNPVNSSSWFYAATLTSDVSDALVSVDEFDNLKHDAYWGLGVDGSGNYILSYTLEGALTQATTAAGRLLRLQTDYAAAYGSTRLISLPNDPFAGVAAAVGVGSVTAVPEPATWGLMGLGLFAVMGAARRHQAGARAAA